MRLRLDRALRARHVGWRILFGVLTLAILIATRWAWIDCDGGTPSLTEYGYFATDEGYYCSGGKNAYLYGELVNVLRSAPNTYAICPGLHVMTWGAFSLFGQTIWAHRVFPLLIHTAAWLVVFWALSRRTAAWLAFMLCACCLLNPFLMAYSRTACNDTLMSAVVLVGYVLAIRRGLLLPFLGGCVFGLGLWVKVSIWVLVGFGFSAALMHGATARRWRRLLCFSGGFCLTGLLSWGAIRLLIYPDAVAQSVTVSQLLALSDSSYPLPSLLDWRSTLKAISTFPRYPTDGFLGVWVPLIVVLPALLLLRRLTDCPVRWDGRLLFYLTFLLYAGGILILPVYYAHYLIPLMAFAPLLWLAARRDLRRWSGRQPGLSVALLAACLIWVAASFFTYQAPVQEARTLVPYLANAYNLPDRVMWEVNGHRVLAAALALFVCGLWARQQRLRCGALLGVALSACGVASLCFSLLIASEAHKYSSAFADTVKPTAFVIQAGALLLFFVVWGVPQLARQGVRWYLLLALLLCFGTGANPAWMHGTCELAAQNHLQQRAVADLARLVPENAVVIGERAPQLLLSLKARAAAAVNGDPVPLVFRMHQAHPDRPLFALLDSEHWYHYQHYQKAANRIHAQVRHTLRLPSFGTGKPVPVYLVSIDVLPDVLPP